MRYKDARSSRDGEDMSESTKTTDMVDVVGKAIAAADGGRFAADRARYRRLAVAAIRPPRQADRGDGRCRPRGGLVRCALGGQQSARFRKGGESDDHRGHAGRFGLNERTPIRGRVFLLLSEQPLLAHGGDIKFTRDVPDRKR